MNKIILTIMFLFICVEAHAGFFIFHRGETITGKQGSCGAVCSNNPNALRVNKSTFDSTTTNLHKVVNNAVVNKTQAEIDADTQARADAQAQAELQKLSDIDSELDSININDISLPLTDAEIDSLGVSQDAKNWFKKFVRYIVSRQSSN